MKAYYVQKADKIFPIYGVNSIEEAREFVLPEDQKYIIETGEEVFMNPETGSVGFASDWDNLSEVVKVRFSADEESWIEA